MLESVVITISRENHRLIGGRLLRTDKQFRHLKQRQKEQISAWLFEEYQRIWQEIGREPSPSYNQKIVSAVMTKVEAAGIWIPTEQVKKYFSLRKSHYRARIAKQLQAQQKDAESTRQEI